MNLELYEKSEFVFAESIHIYIYIYVWIHIWSWNSQYGPVRTDTIWYIYIYIHIWIDRCEQNNIHCWQDLAFFGMKRGNVLSWHVTLQWVRVCLCVCEWVCVWHHTLELMCVLRSITVERIFPFSVWREAMFSVHKLFVGGRWRECFCVCVCEISWSM